MPNLPSTVATNPFEHSPRISEHPFGYDVSLRNIADHTRIWVFGNNPTAASTEETICDQSLRVTYLTNGVTLKIETDSTDDGDGEAGARTIHIHGCDTDFAYKEGIYTLVAETGAGVTTPDKWYRPFYADVYSAGGIDAPTGTIYIAPTGSSDDILLQIDAGQGISHAAMYTVPISKTLYITEWWGSEQTNKGVRISGFTKGPSSDDQCWHEQITEMTNAGSFSKAFTLPFPVAEKHDIEIRVTGGAVDGVVSAGFQGWLE